MLHHQIYHHKIIIFELEHNQYQILACHQHNRNRLKLNLVETMKIHPAFFPHLKTEIIGTATGNLDKRHQPIIILLQLLCWSNNQQVKK